MATFRKVIAMVDSKKPNAFTEEQKFQWLADLDGNIAADIWLVDIGDIRQLGYTYPGDMDRDLLVSYPHEGIYDAWLSAMIDYENGEYDKYQNTMQIFKERLSRFSRWFGRTYEPAQGGWVRRPGTPTWYLTAYGLACSQGFTGTLEEWLQSLVGPPGVVPVTGAAVGDTVVVTAVDANGVPTAWKAVPVVSSLYVKNGALWITETDGNGYSQYVPTDSTLTDANLPANAKAVGDALSRYIGDVATLVGGDA